MQSVKVVIDFLKSHQLKLSTAESCTAGLMATKLADIPGCGAVFERGYVVYAPEAKNDCLGVSFATIEEHGLTSEPVAREMALGALRNSESSMAIANTGVAESEDEDLDGTVCFAWALRQHGREHVVSETKQFDGSRNQVRELAAQYGLLKIPECYRQMLDA
ncbi:CinA family protein [Pseudomonas saliphila]|uniref:CinA family protein n=1 Tax=Pseudomonas saliphila TaxID=2586906 RepID=UPI00123BDDBC|nr:CinA family protein [Pseudomonas saliphila]